MENSEEREEVIEVELPNKLEDIEVAKPEPTEAERKKIDEWTCLFIFMFICLLIICGFMLHTVLSKKQAFEMNPLLAGMDKYDLDTCDCRNSKGQIVSIGGDGLMSIRELRPNEEMGPVFG